MTVDPSRTADEGEDEDEHDDEMSEPNTNNEDGKSEKSFRRTKQQKSYGHCCP